MSGPQKRSKGRPTPAAREEIESAIARAALMVFRAHPAHEATIERIAAVAGVSRNAIYRRYPDRAALLSAAIAPVVQAWVDEFVEIIAQAPSPIEALRRCFKAMADDIADGDRDLRRLMIMTGPHDGPFLVDITRWRRAFEELFDRIIADAIARGQILPGDPAMLREMLFHLLVEGPAHQALTARWQEKEGGDRRPVSFEDRWAFALRGLTDRGSSRAVPLAASRRPSTAAG